MNNRFKNYGLWVSIAAFIPMLLNGFGIDILPKNYSEVVNALLGILVTAGLLNNPQTKCKGYLDDKNTEENKDK
ncbi:holin [Clostridium sp. P21]|uniref:Holin n=1 Tax=Clostridium muellerianum TaxID=2716538 RepID=A0A7Y0EHY7_9CLOT|nr:holin [Clostridium muellerianum]NMM62755.1 holin [Clostridium muellerianum]